MTRASVLVPTHDKHTTLPLAIDTVLRQTVADLEVIVIGDGVTAAVREALAQLCERDPRVRFLDFPKGPHHGERYRHDAIATAQSDAIFYLCDDDLLLPDHVADLLTLLEQHNFVQSFNGYVRPDSTLGFFAADLADPETVRLMLDPRLQYNNVSVSGTAHSRQFYLCLGDPWDTTPAGEWVDHHQWRKFFRHPDFRGATSARMTVLQLPTSEDGRAAWTPGQRLRELESWHRLVTGPDGQAEVDRMVAAGARRALGELRNELVEVGFGHRQAVTHLADVLAAREAAVAAHDQLLAEHEKLFAEHEKLVEHWRSAVEQRDLLVARLERAQARLERKNETISRLRALRRDQRD